MNILKGEYLSQFLCLVLRHRPETLQLTLDAYGYAKIDDILTNAKENGYMITEADFNKVVLHSVKKRFKIVGDRIKAIQGHSFEILVEDKGQEPPKVLYHGTKTKLKEIITQQGLVGMKRSLVQLYENYYAAFMLKPEPVVFEIDAEKMYSDGFEFYLYDGVWQTKTVPANYLTFKALHNFEPLKRITVTKETYYHKLISADIKVTPGYNSGPFLYISGCYLCGSKWSTYSVEKTGVRCNEVTYERPAKSHSLPGKIIGYGHYQNDQEVVVKCVFEIGVKKDSKLYIENDVSFQGMGIRYHCPECDEWDFISNMSSIGKEYKCKKCNVDLFRIDKPTKITQVESDW